MAQQQDLKERVSSVKNIEKITRAMEMVAAARLRKAEQRIVSLRPYADAVRRMTAEAAAAAGEVPNIPILAERKECKRVALLLVTGDRGLAGAFNSQILRAGFKAAKELKQEGIEPVFYVTGRKGLSTLTFRGVDVEDSYTGFTDSPVYGNAREIAEALMVAFIDGSVDRVDIFYNSYISALSQDVSQQTLLPLSHAAVLEPDTDERSDNSEFKSLVEYEPDPVTILQRLVPDYVEISLFRALLESAASEHGARMTAMRNASENAGELMQTLTLEMNRVRQSAITQEILEVVGGANAL